MKCLYCETWESVSSESQMCPDCEFYHIRAQERDDLKKQLESLKAALKHCMIILGEARQTMSYRTQIYSKVTAALESAEEAMNLVKQGY